MVFSVEEIGLVLPHYAPSTIFKRFQPYPNGGRKRGAGLGLSIVRVSSNCMVEWLIWQRRWKGTLGHPPLPAGSADIQHRC